MDGWMCLIGQGKDCKEENAFMRFNECPFMKDGFLNRKSALVQACEQAFKILEKM